MKNLFVKRSVLFIVTTVLFFSTITTMAADYYWVGGSGFWSDINHWATSSGGNVLHSQVPTAADDVYFDANSFSQNGDKVIINLKNAVCHDIVWDNALHNPKLSGVDTTNLRIFGSLKFITAMQQEYDGQVVFDATSGQHIVKSAGHPFNGSVVFQGIGGEWHLEDNLVSDSLILFTHGTLKTKGKNINAEMFISESGAERKLFLSNSSISVNSWIIDGTSLEMRAMLADFRIAALMSNKNGGPLYYPNIALTAGGATVSNENTRTVFQDLNFEHSGTVTGDCNIHNAYFNGAGSISGNDSINYVFIKDNGNISGGSVIDEVVIKSLGTISGNNVIKKITCFGDISLIKINSVDTALFNDNAKIIGANDIHYLRVTKKTYIDSSNTIFRADLFGDGRFKGNNNFHYLNFSPGFAYSFAINSRQTVLNQWNLPGNCSAPIRIMSDTNGVQAIVKVTGNKVVGSYLSLRDMKAVGNTPFHAEHSVDLGNNENWIIETTNGIDLYWVNGAGNWSNNTHWDTYSGGQGGHCPPTEIDNAIFDAASFSAANQYVTIDVENAVCKDMDWKNGVNAPVLFGSDTNNLHIYGSLTEATSMNWLLGGFTYFEATVSGQTITTSGHPFVNSILFEGRGGSWDFKDNLETQKQIVLELGTINTLGNEVRCLDFYSGDTTTRGLHLSTTSWYMNSQGNPAWQLNANNLTLTADSSWLISSDPLSHIISFGNKSEQLVYNNVTFYGNGSHLINNRVYCFYNVVDHYGITGEISGNCTIDSALFHKQLGLILGSYDTINVAIFDKPDGEIRGGENQVKKAIFKDDGIIKGNNKVDTALFYRNGSIFDTNQIDTTIIYNKALIKGNNSIRTATLLGNGQFIGQNFFNDLTFTKTKSYYLEHDNTQTVYDNFNANGTCTGPIFIQSDKNTQQAIIKKVNGTIEANYLQLRDIKGKGSGTPFIAYNSVDLGDNINWKIYISSPKELYWVNGKGNWSDSLHWAGMSGGVGGYCIPTPIDNVYFDENSFLDINDTVNIDIGNATCHNMDWTGAKFTPVFYSPDTNFMRIYGGVVLNDNMNLQLLCPVIFESTHGDNHISCKSVSFISPVYFQGIGGEWYLDDSFFSTSTLFFKYGTLYSQKNKIYVGAFKTNYSTPRTIKVDSSLIILSSKGTEVWFMNGLNMEFSGVGTNFVMTSDNAIFRTDNGGHFHYHYVTGYFISRIYNKSTNVSFDKIYFDSAGQVHGNCTIDTVISNSDLSIFDSDNINFMQSKAGELLLQGGSHKVKTVLAGETGTISGNNTIDTVIIGSRGTLSGTNKINKIIIFGGIASIYGNNNIHYALLKNNGNIYNENVFDSLKFTPGNIYQLQEGKTQTINKDFLVRGNNCFPITLRSQYDGQQAFIYMPQGRTVSGDFIEIKDINAMGGATYYAGHYSTDLADNSGWIFDNAPGYIFGFNKDTVACSGVPMTIGTDSFNPDDNSTFLWQDGSTNSYFQLTGQDTIWVTVNYADNCSYTDTMTIQYKNSPQVDLGNNRTMCEGDTIGIQYHSDSVSFVWSNGSTDTVTTVTQQGYYGITVINAAGCKASDSIYVNAIPAPEVNLGPDTTIYSNQNYMLDAYNSGAKYFWSTGDTTQTIVVNSEGNYWVAVSKEGCIGYDTISISVYPDCILAVPNAFSPNGDGHNDILYARGEGFTKMEIMIFNRIGEMVFETKDSSIGWNGSFKGSQQPVDSYMYILKGLCISGRSVFKKGNITLLR